jgi:hypothetical protein
MNVRHPRKPPQFNYSRISRPLLLALFGTGFYVAIITYAEIADWAESVSGKRQRLTKGLQTDVSTTIAVVRVLQGLLLATSSFALTRSFAILQWSLMARALDNGISYHELLALSPTTLNWGAFRIVFHGSSRMKERVWSAFKCVHARSPEVVSNIEV